MTHKLLMAAILLLALAPISSGLGVEGVIFDVEAAPGQHVSHEITASLRENEGPMDLQVDVLDWGQSLDGSNHELEMGMVACRSAKDFLRASPDRIHLEPGESQKILVEGDVPADVGPGGRYALISVHSLASGDEAEGSDGTVGVAVAINALVRLTVSGTELQRVGEIVELSTGGPSNVRNQNISLIFKNTGNYHYKAQAEAALKDNQGNTLASSQSPLSSNIIPCASRIFRVPLMAEGDLLPGTYSIIAAVKQEDGSILATKETEIVI
jgi:hypothetical protein